MNKLRHPSERLWMAALFLLVFAVGLLISSGRFHSVDEAAMFTAAHNLVNEGRPHTNQMGYSLWAIREGEAVNSLSPDGNLYTKKSPLMILLIAPLIALSKLLPWSSTTVVLWLGPLLTGGTAVLLYHLARQLNYQRSTATITTLLFAFTTMALPYSQTIFGELLAAFGMMLALSAFTHLRGNHHPARTAFLCGLGAALAIGVNPVYTATALIWALGIGGGRTTNNQQSTINREQKKSFTIHNSQFTIHNYSSFILPIAILAIGLLAYNYIRFSEWLTTGYNFAPGQEGFTTPLWWGLAGLLISPARGLLWYSFPVALGLLGLPRFWRRERTLSVLMLAVIAVQFVAFALWWEWWGGYGWGPRFLLPVVPYLLVFALPFVQTAVNGQRSAQIILIITALIGLLVQIAGVSVDANRYEERLDANFPAPVDAPLRYHHNPALVYDVAASPIFYHWQQMLAGNADNLALLQPTQPPQLSEIIAAIQTHQQPGDRLLFVEPSLLDEVLEAAPLPAYGLPYNIDPADELAQSLFRQALGAAPRIWLLTWYARGDPANWYEANLRADWASVRDEWLGDLRLILLAREPETAVSATPQNIPFGPITLATSQVQQNDNTLFVNLTWQGNEAMVQDYVSFVHILDADGNLIAQQDRPPLNGYRQTSGWAASEPITDRFAFPLPPEQLAGARVIVGWYEWPSLTRLTLPDGADAYELR